MLAFALYTAISLVLSARTFNHSQGRAGVLQIAARQRTLAERYTKEVLLAQAGAPSAATPIAHALEQSVNAMLEGGLAPAVPGDDDEARLSPLRGVLLRRQLLQERRLIHDLLATGDAVMSGRAMPTQLTAHERLPREMPPLARLAVLTGLTSNVSLNVARTIGRGSDRSVSNLISLQRLLAAVGLAVFGILGWALVTSTRRRTAHFQSLVTSTTDLVLAFTDAQCRYASNSVLEMIGCTEDAVLGDGIIAFVHPEDRAGLRAALHLGSPSSVAFRLPDQRHGYRELEANVTDLRSDRYVRGIVLNARDVTERNLADSERERLFEHEKLANERLREIDRLKDEFVALVSHEVRTPLSSIKGFLELLSDEQLTPEQQAFTNVIGRNAERLLSLITDLLTIGEIESGRLSVEHNAIDLGPIVTQALVTAALTAEAGGVALSGDDGLSLPITGDATRLAQLVDNLISNAIKFTPPGGMVEVAAGGESGTVWIEVRDTGIGINAIDRERLFNKFFRTHAATRSSIQGTGLGLAIAKAIVQAHGGSIEVESEEGRGSTFRVELPIGDRARSDKPQRTRRRMPDLI